MVKRCAIYSVDIFKKWYKNNLIKLSSLLGEIAYVILFTLQNVYIEYLNLDLVTV